MRAAWGGAAGARTYTNLGQRGKRSGPGLANLRQAAGTSKGDLGRLWVQAAAIKATQTPAQLARGEGGVGAGVPKVGEGEGDTIGAREERHNGSCCPNVGSICTQQPGADGGVLRCPKRAEPARAAVRCAALRAAGLWARVAGGRVAAPRPASACRRTAAGPGGLRSRVLDCVSDGLGQVADPVGRLEAFKVRFNKGFILFMRGLPVSRLLARVEYETTPAKLSLPPCLACTREMASAEAQAAPRARAGGPCAGSPPLVADPRHADAAVQGHVAERGWGVGGGRPACGMPTTDVGAQCDPVLSLGLQRAPRQPPTLA